MSGLPGLPFRDDLMGEEPYSAPQIDVPMVLNVSENPYPLSGELRRVMREAIQEAATTMNRHPDREAVALREDPASYLGNGLTVCDIWMGNGSNKTTGQLLTTFGGSGRRMLTFTPTYSMYSEYAHNTCIAYVTEPHSPDLIVDTGLVLSVAEHHTPAVVVTATPNSPTGTCTAPEVTDEIYSTTDVVVVVDEAYQELSHHPGTLPLLARHPRPMITRTISRAFVVAGGHVEYLAVIPRIMDVYRIVRLPYHMSLQAQVLTRVTLVYRGELLVRVKELAEEYRVFQGWLQGYGYEVMPPEASLVPPGRFKDRHFVWQGLLNRGVLIRETGLEGFLRAFAGTPWEMATLKRALTEINSKGRHP